MNGVISKSMLQIGRIIEICAEVRPFNVRLVKDGSRTWIKLRTLAQVNVSVIKTRKRRKKKIGRRLSSNGSNRKDYGKWNKRRNRRKGDWQRKRNVKGKKKSEIGSMSKCMD